MQVKLNGEKMNEKKDTLARQIEIVTLIVTISAGVGITTKADWIVPLYVYFCMWAFGYGIAVFSSYLRRNKRNMMLFTFTSLNTAYGAYNWY